VAGFVLGDGMSWKNVLKDEEKVGPKPVEKPVMGTWDKSGKRLKFHQNRKRKLEREKASAKTKDSNLFDFGKQEVKDFPIKPNSPTFKIWEAASTDEKWAEFTKEPLTSSQVQSVQKAKRLLQGQVVNVRGTDFKLRDNPFDNPEEMIARLENIKPKNTKATGGRESVVRDVKRMVDDEEFADLLNLLQGKGEDKYADKLSNVAQRARKVFAESKQYREKLLSISEDKHPEITKIKQIVGIGGVPSLEIQQTIPDDMAVSYIQKILASRASPRKKTQFLFDAESDMDGLPIARLLFGGRRLTSLDFILENEALNESNIPTNYKKRNIIERSAIRDLLDDLIDEPKIKTIFDKYRKDIEAYEGRKGESEEEKQARFNLREEKRGAWNNISRKAATAKRNFFNEVREKANAEFQEAMSDVTGETNPMTVEIRDAIKEALEDEDADDFTDAIKKLGIDDNFESIQDIEEKLDIDEVLIALDNMVEMPNKTLRPKAGDIDTLRFFEEEEVDAWSILDEVMDDDITIFESEGKGGTLDKIIIVMKRLGELYDGPDIDEQDLTEGRITNEEFKDLILESYEPIREAFLNGVKERMKQLAKEGVSFGTKIPSPAGGMVEPVVWIGISTGAIQ
jgi:hypothetical protein